MEAIQGNFAPSAGRGEEGKNSVGLTPATGTSPQQEEDSARNGDRDKKLRRLSLPPPCHDYLLARFGVLLCLLVFVHVLVPLLPEYSSSSGLWHLPADLVVSISGNALMIVLVAAAFAVPFGGESMSWSACQWPRCHSVRWRLRPLVLYPSSSQSNMLNIKGKRQSSGYSCRRALKSTPGHAMRQEITGAPWLTQYLQQPGDHTDNHHGSRLSRYELRLECLSESVGLGAG